MGGESYEVRTRGGVYYVADADGKRVSRTYSQAQLAHNALVRIEAEARQRDRTCMTCRRTFLSDGPHNRMCQPCRARAADDPQAPYRVLTGGAD